MLKALVKLQNEHESEENYNRFEELELLHQTLAAEVFAAAFESRPPLYPETCRLKDDVREALWMELRERFTP